MAKPEEHPTLLDNRRQNERRESTAEINVKVDSGTIHGRAENISAAGVFFFTPDRVRVQVEVQEDGRTKTYTGRIVRVESLSTNSFGFAIEFDRD
jgi:hypothetical protein